MSDWAVGDLALCIKGGGWNTSAGPDDTGPETGDVHRVEKIMPCPRGLRKGEPGLRFAPWPDFFGGHRFRKILPDKHESCETEFVTLLNRIKRKVSA